MRALEMVHAEDPRQQILTEVKAYTDQIRVLGPELLCCVYMRPKQTKSGLTLPDSYRKEDEFQGKVGLVIKMGPIAFQDDADHRFGNIAPKIGDWVLFRVGDTFELIVGDRKFRIVQDVNVRAILDAPDIVL